MSASAYLQALHAVDEPVEHLQAESSTVTQRLVAPTGDGISLESESAFPSLGPSALSKGKKAVNGSSSSPLWAAATSNRTGSSVASSSRPETPLGQSRSTPSVYRESLTLDPDSIELGPSVSNHQAKRRGEDNSIASLGDAASLIMRTHPGVKVDVSSGKSGATFLFAGPNEESIRKARQDLLASIAKKITTIVLVPLSVIPYIVGSKGRNLKQLQELTGAQIQLPKSSQSTNVTDSAQPADVESADGPEVVVTIYGSPEACEIAKERIEAAVADRAAKVVHSAKLGSKSVDDNFWPFLSRELATTWQENDLSVTHIANVGIEVQGEKEKVARAVTEIESLSNNLRKSLKSVSFVVPQKQHRFLRGSQGAAVLAKTGWAMELPTARSGIDQVTIRGPASNKVGRAEAMEMVMSLADSAEVDTIFLAELHPGDDVHAANLLRYFARSRALSTQFPSIQIFLPTPTEVAANRFEIEIAAVSSMTQDAEDTDHLKQRVNSAKDAIVNVIQRLTPNRVVPMHVDPLLYRHLRPQDSSAGAKQNKILAPLLDKHPSIELYWPKEAESGTNGAEQLLMVWSGPAEPEIPAFRSEFIKIISSFGEIKTRTIEIPKALHDAIRGPNDTTLNVLIGEDKTVGIKFGPGDNVEIRGPASQLARVQKEMEAIAARAELEGIEADWEASFDLESRFVGHVVGKDGANVKRLTSELGVRIRVEDDMATETANVLATKKSKKSRAHIVIKGRRENVEEAKKRMIAQAERIADEASASVLLPADVHRGVIIGKQGAYSQRLEAKYEVKINFPRGTSSDSEEITIRGPKKGVEAAKKELIELIEYEREQNRSTSFQVPASAISRIVGKQGATITELQAVTGAIIDISPDSENQMALVTLKGNKESILAARQEISTIVQDSAEEAVLEIRVSRAHQPSLIGKGGQNIKDMMARVGGPTDVKAQGYMLRLPRPNDEPSDLIVLRGKKSIVEKLKKEILDHVKAIESRVLYGVGVPRIHHASIIGRGGQVVSEISSKYNVKIIFPNWTDAQADSPIINASECSDVVAEDLIRIFGDLSDCKSAAAEIEAKALSRNAGPLENRQKSAGLARSVERTVDVPANHHRFIADGGKFFRRVVPPQVNISHLGKSLPATKLGRPKPFSQHRQSARIDDEPDAEDEVMWEVHELLPSSTSEESIPWHITAPSEAMLDSVEEAIREALAKAERQTHLAYLRVPREVMPRIIGRQGAGLDSIRAMSNAEVEVLGRRDADTLSFVGSLENVEAARAHVLNTIGRS